MIEPSRIVLPNTAQTEETRQKIREHALRSTYFLGKAIVGFTDMSPTLHRHMGDWISDGGKRKLGLVPRDHLKTSIWTIADTVRRIAGNPNIRILLGNETATNASHFLRRIEAVFERNGLFQWLFPEVIPDFSKCKKWSETEMLVPRTNDYPESTVEAIGVGGAVVSRHFNLIKLDDLVGKEASESADVMLKTIDWYQYCESILESPKDNEIHTYGTRWAYSDLYSWILEHEAQDITTYIRAGIEDGEAIWPERFDIEVYDRLLRKYGSFKFNCQYMNNPVDPEAASFNEKWLRFYRWGGELGGHGIIETDTGQRILVQSLRRFMRIDPAISERPGAARSAIVVDGVAPDGRVFLLETWAKRCQPFEMIDKMFELQDEYDCESVGFESIAYQRILKPTIEREAERRGRWVNVIEMRPDSREKKDNRIRGIQPWLERGLVWVRKDMPEFLDEYRSFPVGKTVDVLDAFAYGPHQWSAPLDEVDEQMEQFKIEVNSGRNATTGY